MSGLAGTEGLLDRLGAFRAKPNDRSVGKDQARVYPAGFTGGALIVIISFSCGSFAQDRFHLEKVMFKNKNKNRKPEST